MRIVNLVMALGIVLGALGVPTGGDAATAAPGADPAALFRQACDLYERGDFGSALAQFEAIRASGIENAAVYYNIGNCYYREGRMGRAVASYRRAILLAPRDEDIRANLALIRQAVGSGDTTATDGAAGVATLPLRFLSAREFRICFYVGYYIAAGCLLAALFFGGRVRRFALYGLGAAVVVAGLGLGLSRQGISDFRSASGGVVVTDRADLKSGPGEAFQEIAALADGLEVRLRARSGIWVEVQLPTGEVGWLRDTDFEAI